MYIFTKHFFYTKQKLSNNRQIRGICVDVDVCRVSGEIRKESIFLNGELSNLIGIRCKLSFSVYLFAQKSCYMCLKIFYSNIKFSDFFIFLPFRWQLSLRSVTSNTEFNYQKHKLHSYASELHENIDSCSYLNYRASRTPD